MFALTMDEEKIRRGGCTETMACELECQRRGRALRIAEADRPRVLGYLAEREMPEEIYSCRKVALETVEGPVESYTLVVNRDHPLYVGQLTVEEMAVRIARSSGTRGPNRAYLEQTVRHMDELGIAEGALHRLLDRVAKIASRAG